MGYCMDVSQCKADGKDCPSLQNFFLNETDCCIGSKPEPKLTPGGLGLGTMLGMQRQWQLQSSIFTILALLCVVGSAVTSSLVVTRTQEAPLDFVSKGTLSNVSQNTATPHGRLFAVSLFTAGLLQIFSMYSFWLYRSWIPRVDLQADPFIPPIPFFADNTERCLRTVWVILPQVGFMLTASIPSLSENARTYELALTLTHNIVAPLSMAFMLIMETFQLAYGEEAFQNFFNTKQFTLVYGPLTKFQRSRVIIVIYTWIAVCIFLSVQIYLGLAYLGIRINPTHPKALVSYFSEVTALILAFALPAVAAMEIAYWNAAKGAVMSELRVTVVHGPWGPWPR